jgi:hypothetical protein
LGMSHARLDKGIVFARIGLTERAQAQSTPRNDG